MSEANAKVQALVNKHSRIRVRISDGRLIEGELHCIDMNKNLIVAGALELHGMQKDDGEAQEATLTRSLGTAMIPGLHILRIVAVV